MRVAWACNDSVAWARDTCLSATACAKEANGYLASSLTSCGAAGSLKTCDIQVMREPVRWESNTLKCPPMLVRPAR